MTAQHAHRQGKHVARNAAASLDTGKAQPTSTTDEGFLADLGGLTAAANPLGVPLSGAAANAVTRGYHLFAKSREPAAGTRRLGAERGHACGSHIVRGDQRQSVPLDVDKPRA